MKRLIAIITITAAIAAATVLALTEGNNVTAQETTTESTEDERFYMLNALWFKPDGGQAKYMEYIAAASPFVAEYGGKSDASYIPEASLIGDFDADLVFFVEWPNDKAFTTFIQDERYQAISHLRDEAITKSLLVRCKKM